MLCIVCQKTLRAVFKIIMMIHDKIKHLNLQRIFCVSICKTKDRKCSVAKFTCICYDLSLEWKIIQLVIYSKESTGAAGVQEITDIFFNTRISSRFVIIMKNTTRKFTVKSTGSMGARNTSIFNLTFLYTAFPGLLP